jgi:hypothetical protein
MLFALPGYQFPYTVMNRCLYLTDDQGWQKFGTTRSSTSSRLLKNCPTASHSKENCALKCKNNQLQRDARGTITKFGLRSHTEVMYYEIRKLKSTTMVDVLSHLIVLHHIVHGITTIHNQDRCPAEWGELTASYRWSGWVWKTTGWSSWLPRSSWSF